MPVEVDDDSMLGEFLANHADIAVEPTCVNGAEFGDWAITGFLGRGGSSEVYCVRHRETGARAALKVLYRTEKRHKERFHRESEFLKGNANEALPLFYEAGQKDSRPYMVMELLEPKPLPVGDAEVARYICTVAEGLAWLHAKGFVHRDVKPRNILFRNGTRPVLVDFGLIKGIAHELVQKCDGISVVDGKNVGVGTPRYAAPEQFAGGDVTPATDIHALGRLAYECFDGHPPRVWSRIIRHATSSISDERYQTASSFILAVRRRHWHRNAVFAVLAVALPVCAALLWIAAGGVEDAKWRLMGESVTTNLVCATVSDRTSTVDGIPTKIVYGSCTNSVRSRIVRLNGATNVFSRPLRLSPERELWIVGPGTLDCAFAKSDGAVVRISNCTLLNRTEESLKDIGIKYVLYKNVVLDFKNIPRDAEDERAFLTSSTLDFPDDNTAMFKGSIVPYDDAFAKVKYMKSEKEYRDDLEFEKAIIKARLKSEMRHDPRFRDIDADLIVE